MSDWLKTFQTGLPPEYVCRKLTKEDGELEGIEIDNPITGGTLEKNGVPVAYAGINLVAGYHYCFFYLKDEEVRKYGLWIVRLIRDSIHLMEDAGIKDMYALCDNTKPNAESFLKLLGFEPMDTYQRSIEMLVYEKLMGGVAKTWHRPAKRGMLT